MKTTKTITYALACLKELAMQFGEYVQVAEIARNQNVPAAYCQKILLTLSRAGLVESVKGRGFTLSRPVEQITTLEVTQSLASDDPTERVSEENNAVKLISEIISSRVNRALSELSVAEVVRA